MEEEEDGTPTIDIETGVCMWIGVCMCYVYAAGGGMGLGNGSWSNPLADPRTNRRNNISQQQKEQSRSPPTRCAHSTPLLFSTLLFVIVCLVGFVSSSLSLLSFGLPESRVSTTQRTKNNTTTKEGKGENRKNKEK